jgi:hypothetical protein
MSGDFVEPDCGGGCDCCPCVICLEPLSGTQDNAPQINAAIVAAAPGTEIVLCPGVFTTNDSITVDRALTIRGPGVLRPILPLGHATGRVVDISASGVTIDGLEIDCSAMPTPLASTRYPIFASGGIGTELDRIRIEHCNIHHATASDGAMLVTHAIYSAYCTAPLIESNDISDPSGAGIFLAHCTHVLVRDNRIEHSGWYSLVLQKGVHGGDVSSNTITGTLPGCRLFGGSIYLFSDGADESENCTDLDVHDNDISGRHDYYVAIGASSSLRCCIHHNKVHDVPRVVVGPLDNLAWDNVAQTVTRSDPGGSWIADGVHQYGAYTISGSDLNNGSKTVANVSDTVITWNQACVAHLDDDSVTITDYPTTLIRADTRGASGWNRGPTRDLDCHDNTLTAMGSAQNGIYIDCQGYGVAVAPMERIAVHHNHLISTGQADYFNAGAIVSGSDGGGVGIDLCDNQGTGKPGNGPIDGFVGIQANTAQHIQDVRLCGNNIRFAPGSSAGSAEIGIFLGQYVDGAVIDANVVDGFWYNIRSDSLCGPWTLGRNTVRNFGGIEYLLSGAPTAGFIEWFGATPPATGWHWVGERLWYSAPVSGGPPGEVCVTAGGAGIWKTMGVLS